MNDTNITIGLRRSMIDELASKLTELKFTNFESILQIMSKIPRHAFAPMGFETMAYEINPVLIDEDQTMSSPLTVAIQTLVLNPQPTDKILEIGTGSGYQASVLSQLCLSIYTLERHKILHEKAKLFLKELNYKNIYCFLKDGFEGLPIHAPYDKIIITCGAESIPDTLITQLKIGGEMLIPLESKKTMKRIIKLTESEIYEEEFGDFQFVPMLKGVNK
jgi:protein-L-isoaspartate(D-aspartate) O-methyltransferase